MSSSTRRLKILVKSGGKGRGCGCSHRKTTVVVLNGLTREAVSGRHVRPRYGRCDRAVAAPDQVFVIQIPTPDKPSTK